MRHTNQSATKSAAPKAPNTCHVAKSPAVSPAYAFNQRVAQKAEHKAMNAKPNGRWK
jgi:hypothetical protein